MAKKAKKRTRQELRTLRMQQMIFVFIGLIVILSMVLAMVAR